VVAPANLGPADVTRPGSFLFTVNRRNGCAGDGDLINVRFGPDIVAKAF